MTTWVKVYDTLRGHRKALQAGDRAMWLYVCGLSYANEQQTDGFIPEVALPAVAPGVKSPERLAALLVAAELWHASNGGWEIHDYLAVQRSADEIAERKRKDRERKSNGIPHGIRVESDPTPNGFHALDTDTDKRRGKEAPNGASPSGSADADREARLATEDDLESCRLFFELGRQRNPKMRVPRADTSERTTALRDMRLLRTADHNTVEEIQSTIRWLFTDPGKDAVFWGTTIQAPSGLREHFSQVVSKMHAVAPAPAAALSIDELVARDEARRAANRAAEASAA